MQTISCRISVTMGEVPPDAGGSTSCDPENRRNSPASSVCYESERALDVEHHQSTSEMEQQAIVEPPVHGEDNTPRSEDPAVDPPGLEPHVDGYFSPVTGLDVPPPHLSTDSAMASFVEPVPSRDAAISHLDLTNLASGRSTQLEHVERPTPQHTLSNLSTTSTATVKQADYMPQQSRPLTRPHSTHPHFPNQAYSALQTQQHPTPYQPPQLRTRSSNPSPYLSYVTAANRSKDFVSPPSGSRTAGNSPSGSPGLFNPGSSPNRPKSVHEDPPGTYSSPFLHYTQRTVPKE